MGKKWERKKKEPARKGGKRGDKGVFSLFLIRSLAGGGKEKRSEEVPSVHSLALYSLNDVLEDGLRKGGRGTPGGRREGAGRLPSVPEDRGKKSFNARECRLPGKKTARKGGRNGGRRPGLA